MFSKEVRFARIHPVIDIRPQRNSEARALGVLSELSLMLSTLEILRDPEERDQIVEVINSIDLMSQYRDQVLLRQSSSCSHPEDSKDPFCKNPVCSIGLVLRHEGVYTRKYEGWKFHPFYIRSENYILPRLLKTTSEFADDLKKRIEIAKSTSYVTKKKEIKIHSIPISASYSIEDPDAEILTHETEFEQLLLTGEVRENNATVEAELARFHSGSVFEIFSFVINRGTLKEISQNPIESIDILTMLAKEGEHLPFYLMPASTVGCRYRDRIFIRGLRHWFAILINELTESPDNRTYELYFENQFDFPTMIFGQETNNALHATNYLTLKEMHEVIDILSSENWNAQKNTRCEHITFHFNAKTKRVYATDRFGERIGYRGVLLQYNIPKNPTGR